MVFIAISSIWWIMMLNNVGHPLKKTWPFSIFGGIFKTKCKSGDESSGYHSTPPVLSINIDILESMLAKKHTNKNTSGDSGPANQWEGSGAARILLWQRQEDRV